MDVSEISRLPAPSLGEAPTMPLAPGPGPGDREAVRGGASAAAQAGASAAAQAGASAAAQAYQQCDECAAPVDKDQRYCVACGAHRRHVHDPATRYLSQATTWSRASRAPGAAGHRSARPGGHSRGLGTALLLALIPVVAAVGVMVGRSSNNNDAGLIQQLAKRQAAVVTTPAAGAATTAGTASPPAPGAGAGAGRSRRQAKTSKHSRTSTSATKNAGKILSTTQNGSVTQIAGSKPTQAQEQQGAAAAQQVQKSTGKSYVNGQSGLPSTVVVP